MSNIKLKNGVNWLTKLIFVISKIIEVSILFGVVLVLQVWQVFIFFTENKSEISFLHLRNKLITKIGFI